MLKLRLNSKVRPVIFWPSLIILLATSVTVYILEEKERKLKLCAQKRLVQTLLEKKAVEEELGETIKANERVEKEVKVKEHQIMLVLDKLEKEIIARRIAEIQLILATKEKRALRTKLWEFNREPKTVALEKIVVKAVPELFGKVLMVNKEQAFIVVNLGRVNNMRIGDVLSVYRDGEFIGRVQVERVEERVCAAAIMPQWQDVEFKENDKIRGI